MLSPANTLDATFVERTRQIKRLHPGRLQRIGLFDAGAARDRLAVALTIAVSATADQRALEIPT